MFRSILLLVSLSGIYAPPGPGHEHGHISLQTVDNCYGHVCGDKEPICQIKPGGHGHEHGHITGHCVEHVCHLCDGTQKDLGHEGCCCLNRDCVNHYQTAHQSVSGTVHCRHCHDSLTNDCEESASICDREETCLIKFVDKRMEMKCAPKHDCHQEDPHHHGHHQERVVCCQNDTCVKNAVSATGGSGPTCTDLNTSGYCSNDASRICSSIDPQVHELAVKICANTCNFCVEHLAKHGTMTTMAAGGASQSVTADFGTTTSIPAGGASQSATGSPAVNAGATTVMPTNVPTTQGQDNSTGIII